MIYVLFLKMFFSYVKTRLFLQEATRLFLQEGR